MSQLQEHLHRSTACDLCGHPQQWLFILGTGRSGSTSLLQMVNEIPGFHLAGENRGVLTSLSQLFDHAQHLAQKNDSMLSWTHGDILEHKVLCALQSYIRAIGGFSESDRVIGYKEIRHSNEEALSFFQKLFPCARFIANTRRHLDAQIKSRENVGWGATNASALVKASRSLESWARKHQNISILMRLEDNFTAHGFNQLLKWLGVHGCTFMSVAHENRNGYSNISTNGHLQGACKSAWNSSGQARPMHHQKNAHTSYEQNPRSPTQQPHSARRNSNSPDRRPHPRHKTPL